jgi:hypothetical protein
MVRRVEVTICGISPLLMHAFPMIPIEALEKKPKEEQAEYAAYRIPNDSRELYVPGVAIQRALIGGAAYSKGKGRASLQKSAAACLMIDREYVGLGTTEYVLDARPVVIPATKGRIMRYRPKIENWSLSFALDYDDTLLSTVQVRQIVDDTGKHVGLLDFRPEKKGPFGRFVVSSWKTD